MQALSEVCVVPFGSYTGLLTIPPLWFLSNSVQGEGMTESDVVTQPVITWDVEPSSVCLCVRVGWGGGWWGGRNRGWAGCCVRACVPV